MAIEDGYNVERDLLGENNANNEQISDLVTANADGSVVERLEALKVQLTSISTTDLSAAITAIQGSGFATGVDSLKIISDVLDQVKEYVDGVESGIAALNNISTANVNTEVDTALNTIVPAAPVAGSLNDMLSKASGGNTFDKTTDSLEAIADSLVVANAALALSGDAVVADVLITKTFYKDNAQSKLIGTMPNNAGDVASVSAHMDATTNLHVVPATGYTDGINDATTVDLATVDADLVTGNIKAGITLLGVAGKTEVVDTTEVGNPAAEADIANGKIAWVNGAKITGTHI